MAPTVVVADPGAGFAERGADLIANWLTAIDGPATLAAAGGSTPAPVYEELAARDVPWEDVIVWIGDERWVPQDHPDNNGRMVRRVLSERVGATFLPVPFEGESPESAATAYAAQLESVLARRDGTPSPDIVLLGIGDDGHTLSLFPGTAALDEYGRIYTANWVPKFDAWRVTATYKLIDAAQHVLFLVSGAGKADTVARILEDPDAADPAARITSGRGEIVWLLDSDAASRLGGDR